MKKRILHRKKRNLLPVLLALIAILVTIVIYLFIPANKTVSISGYSFGKSNGKSTVSFNLTNKFDLPADCVANVILGERSFSSSLGIVKPLSSRRFSFRLVMPSSQEVFEIKPSCVWQKLDVEGCDNTDFRLCQMSKQDPGLGMCLNQSIATQYFCAAQQKGNATLCNNILEKTNQIRCNAFVGNSPSICDTMPDQAYRDWCYEDYGINKPDLPSCQKIAGKERKNACLGAATQNPEYCLNLSEQGQFDCISNLAELTNDVSLCDMIKASDACYHEFDSVH